MNMQVLLILNATHRSVGGTEIPNPYLDMIVALRFITLDLIGFVPFDCAYERSFNHFGK